MRAKAEGGDGEAMDLLGVWYGHGSNGLSKDMAQARAWYGRSAAAGNPMGMASYGEYLLFGLGGSNESRAVLGLVNVTEAATLGSDLGAFRLGESFSDGQTASRKTPLARGLVKEGRRPCKIQHLDDAAKANAA